MFVNVRLTSGAVNRGFLVPQAGLQRDSTGPYVLVAGSDDKVVLKRVRVDGQHGQDWIVTDGLTEGDRMILSGTQNARPGSVVAAVPYQAQGDASQGAAPAAAAPGR
jgi:membrane fusion protein (multidrug efflux system)